jgi:hypothetical protein
MKIIEGPVRNGGPKVLRCTEEVMFCDIEVSRFDDAQIRELIVYLKKNRPELICPIMCEDCPEHAEQIEAHNYFHNLRETGDKRT